MLEKEDNRYVLEVIHGRHIGHQYCKSPLLRPHELRSNETPHVGRGLLKLHLTEIIPNKLDTGMNKFNTYSKAQSEERIKNDADIKIRDFYSELLLVRSQGPGNG